MDLSDLDIVFISYDEPNANVLFSQLAAISPRQPLRVHGVKGFDAAHKAAAQLATTDRFITVDGDNIVQGAFFDLTLGDEPEDVVYSFSAHNSINGLRYGNGGIKVWPRKLVLSVDTHEKDDGNDFCWTYRYWQRDEAASIITFGSPFQAFRAGFREAVKLSLVENKKLDWGTTRQLMYYPNFSRLLIWTSVGNDVEYGEWAIYGARCGLAHLWLDNLDPNIINDYDWFDKKWRTPGHTSSEYLRKPLEKALGVDLPILTPEQSRWFKAAYVNIERHGLMISDMKVPDAY
jgi:hypothetical protein